MSLLSKVTVFEGLKKQYPDWFSFRTFLESEEGGYLRIIPSLSPSSVSESRYHIIRYDKGVSRMDLPHVSWFRSVVWDTVLHCPVSVAPPKAVASSLPFPYGEERMTDITKRISDGGLTIEEDRDGFMIQVFRVRDDSQIHIATRSRLDASGTFYSGKSFRTLFLEACANQAVEEMTDPVQEDGEEEKKVKETEGEEKGKSACIVAHFYSFLVQHPEHRVVTPVQVPRLYLVQKGVLYDSGRAILTDGFPNTLLIPSSPPEKEETLLSWIQEYCQHQPWWFRGIIVKDTTGKRWRFRSEKYRAIQSLRGNESNLYERYARMFTQNLSSVYLEYYPEEMIPFSLCGVFLNDIVLTLHRIYHAIHVRKSSTFSAIHWVYRPHVYAIHGIYLTTHRTAKKWVTAHDIRMYLMSQPPTRMAFLLRHHQEEYHSRVAQST